MARIKVAIACQGGGSQTAFTAGVLKALAEEQVQREVEVVAISGTSGGSVCAALLWYSYWKGERPVWERLIAFWQDNTAQGFAEQQFNRVLIESLRAVNRGLLPMFQVSPSSPVMQAMLPLMTAGSRRVFTEFPELLRKYIDFAEVAAWGARAGPPVLIIGAANVNTGQLVKFSTAREPLRIEHILASSAVPNIFPAVMIDGQGYWDGLFSDNPPVLELIRPRTVGPGNIPEEIWLIKINPTARAKVPSEPAEILDRRNQLEGNISLFQQLDQIGMINDLVLDGAFRPEFLARYDIRAPVRIPKSFEADPDRPYHIPCIEMPKHLHDRLDYEGKIDRSAANIDWLLEHGEAAGRAFLAERRAAIAASPLPRQAPRADRS